MIVYVDRDPVAAGDDNGDRAQRFPFPDGTTIRDVILGVTRSKYLPFAGDYTTWSVWSNVPLAVVKQLHSYGPDPSHFFWWIRDASDGVQMDRLYVSDGELRLFFSYHAQQDPEVVYSVLRRVCWSI